MKLTVLLVGCEAACRDAENKLDELRLVVLPTEPVNERDERMPDPLLIVIRGAKVVSELSDSGPSLPAAPFSHLDVLKRHAFSFEHQLQPQLVVRQSLHLRVRRFIIS